MKEIRCQCRFTTAVTRLGHLQQFEWTRQMSPLQRHQTRRRMTCKRANNTQQNIHFIRKLRVSCYVQGAYLCNASIVRWLIKSFCLWQQSGSRLSVAHAWITMAVAPLARLSARLNNGQARDRRAQLGLTAAYSMFADGSRRPNCLLFADFITSSP